MCYKICIYSLCMFLHWTETPFGIVCCLGVICFEGDFNGVLIWCYCEIYSNLCAMIDDESVLKCCFPICAFCICEEKKSLGNMTWHRYSSAQLCVFDCHTNIYFSIKQTLFRSLMNMSYFLLCWTMNNFQERMAVKLFVFVIFRLMIGKGSKQIKQHVAINQIAIPFASRFNFSISKVHSLPTR